MQETHLDSPTSTTGQTFDQGPVPRRRRLLQPGCGACNLDQRVSRLVHVYIESAGPAQINQAKHEVTCRREWQLIVNSISKSETRVRTSPQSLQNKLHYFINARQWS